MYNSTTEAECNALSSLGVKFSWPIAVNCATISQLNCRLRLPLIYRRSQLTNRLACTLAFFCCCCCCCSLIETLFSRSSGFKLSIIGPHNIFGLSLRGYCHFEELKSAPKRAERLTKIKNQNQKTKKYRFFFFGLALVGTRTARPTD